MPYVLPPLPYAYDALEPYIDERTMRLHHDTHHAAYVDNLNTALADHPALAELSVEGLIGDLGRVPEGIRATVRDNGGGHANHSLFRATMTPHGLAVPQHAEATGVFAEETTRVFGSLDTFQERLTAAALARSGNGWAWLSLDADGALLIESTANQDSPLMEGRVPVVGVDVWEHAYDLRYQNRRAAYLAAWWRTIDWVAVAARYEAVRDSQQWSGLAGRHESEQG